MRPASEIKQIFSEKRTTHDYITKNLGNKEARIQNLVDLITEQKQEIDTINNILLACKLMLEKITYQNKAKIEQFITYALQTIFTDRNYGIELEIKEDVKRPALTIMLVENGIKQDIKDSVGGGIITTLGFLFQIYYLEVYNKNKVMFIDEGLKEVSKLDEEQSNVDYLSNLLEFLKWLSTEHGYKFVIVTHDDTVKDIADSVYGVKLGKVSLVK